MNRRRVTIAVALSLTLAAGGGGLYASVLNVSAAGAYSAGTTRIVSGCDDHVDYTVPLSWSASAGQWQQTTATVSDVAAACNGATSYVWLDDGTLLASGSAQVAGSTVSVPLSTALDVNRPVTVSIAIMTPPGDVNVPVTSGVQATAFTMSGLAPGDAMSRVLTLYNTGNSDVSTTLSGVWANPTGPMDLSASLRVTVTDSAGTVLANGISLSQLSGLALLAKADSATSFTFSFVFPQPDASLCFTSALQNGSFETPNLAAAPYFTNQSILSTSVSGLYWKNSAENNIELWRSGFQGVPSADGSQFAEMNAFVPGTLYQDLATVPGTTMRWTLSHRARAPGGAGGNDTMRVVIGAAGGSLTQNGPNLTDGATWGSHTGVYTVPAGQTTTRFAFQAVDGYGPSYGNFLDNIVFSGEGCTTDPATMAAYRASGVNLTLNVTP